MRYAQFWFFRKGCENGFSTTLCDEKCFSCYILLTDQISLSNYLYFLRYWAIYIYCNFLITKLWRDKFWNYLPIQTVFLHDEKFKTKIVVSWERKGLLSWSKKRFSSFLKAFQLRKVVRPESAPVTVEPLPS